ncbi:MAG: hypothetical protein ABW168_25280 [Sedimenticola sp.]
MGGFSGDKNIFGPLETQAFKIYLKNKTITLINLYSRDPELTMLQDLNKLLKKDFIIMGDMNAHNKVWGSPFNSRQGKMYLEWVEEIGGVILNDGSHTRISTRFWIYI